jgi:hypothetical protein
MFSACGGAFRDWLRILRILLFTMLISDREDITPEVDAAVLVAMGQAAPGDEEWGSPSGDDDEEL